MTRLLVEKQAAWRRKKLVLLPAHQVTQNPVVFDSFTLTFLKQNVPQFPVSWSTDSTHNWLRSVNAVSNFNSLFIRQNHFLVDNCKNSHEQTTQHGTYLTVNKETTNARRVKVCNGKVGTEQVRNVLGKITASLEIRLAGNYDPVCNNTSNAVLFI